MTISKKKLLEIWNEAYKVSPNISQTCLWNDCCEKPILSHSHSKKFLRNISENNHIFGLSKSFLQKDKGEYFITYGVKQASTFYGFCQYHDSKLFSHIENPEFITIDNQSAFILMMRSLFFEYYQKKIMCRRLSKFKSICEKKRILIDLDYIDSHIDGLKLFNNKEFPSYKETIYEIYNRKDYEKINYLAYSLHKYVPISISTITSPLFSNFVIINQPQSFFTFNIIPYKNRSVIFISWLRKNDGQMQWLKETFSSDQNKLLNYLCFMESEDYYISPNFYNKLNEEEREYLIQALQNRSNGLDYNDTKIIYDFT